MDGCIKKTGMILFKWNGRKNLRQYKKKKTLSKGSNLWKCFLISKKQVYSYETKRKVMKMKLTQVPVKEMINVCGIKNDSQLY